MRYLLGTDEGIYLLTDGGALEAVLTGVRVREIARSQPGAPTLYLATADRVYRSDEARDFLAAAGLDPDAVAPKIDGKFISAFVRATKPATAACCTPGCCAYYAARPFPSTTTRSFSAPATPRAPSWRKLC